MIIWECIKLIAQASTAWVVARFTVRWALSRFKQEKVWERQLSAQADILIALAEIRRLYALWIDEIETRTWSGEEGDREHRERYRAAARKLEEAMPLAQLFLPEEVGEILTKLERDRDSVDTGDRYSDYSCEYGMIDEAITKIVERGRRLLP